MPPSVGVKMIRAYGYARIGWWVDLPLTKSRDLDFDQHARIKQLGGNHGGGRTHITEVLPQHRPASLKVGAVRQDVGDPDDIRERGPRLLERLGNVLEALLGLRFDRWRNAHGRIVEARRAGHKNPVALNHGSGIGDLFFER